MIDEIVSIKEVGMRDLIDIEVTGNHLFYANNILTHNSNSDVGLDETSDSFGLPMAADWMVALIATEELTELGQMMVKQLKSRYDDVNRIKRFVVGVDKPKMRLYDVEQSGQRDIRDGPVADNTEFGRRLSAEENPWSKFDEFK